MDVADNLKALHLLLQEIIWDAVFKTTYVRVGIFYRNDTKASFLLTIIHYGIVVVASIVFDSAIRIFVRSQYVAFINLLAVLVGEASELAYSRGVNSKRKNRASITDWIIFYESLVTHMGQIAVISLPVLYTLTLKLNCSHSINPFIFNYLLAELI